MQLYKIEKLKIRAFVLRKHIFWKPKKEVVGDAVLVYDYIYAQNEESALTRIRTIPAHYMHWGWSGASLGDSISDELDPSELIYVEDVQLFDVTYLPPCLNTLRERMDAHDYLSYCSKYLCANTSPDKII